LETGDNILIEETGDNILIEEESGGEEPYPYPALI
jgi:hypothetical protein